MLVEACEYRANFLHLCPQAAVILGIEPDHFDCYRTQEELEGAFGRFARSLPGDGLLVVNGACAATRRVAAQAACRVETFAIDGRADWQAAELRHQRGNYTFEISHRGRPLCGVTLRVPGRHHVANALAAAALAWHAGVPAERIGAGLSAFRGLRRRMEMLGTWQGATLVDDYAHHPTEVVAALRTVRQSFPNRRILCVFQPHQVSRTAHLLDELAASLQNADVVLVAEIFRAREPGPRSGEVTAADLAERVRAGGRAVPRIHAVVRIERFLEDSLRPGDVLVTLGAGDIGKICHGFIDRLRQDRAAG